MCEIPPLNGKGMSTRTLTPEEEAAYRALARAARRLRRAQEQAGRLPEDRQQEPAADSRKAGRASQ